MRKFKGMLVAAVALSLFAAGVSLADVVSVSSFTANPAGLDTPVATGGKGATLVPGNGSTRHAVIFNDSTAVLYISPSIASGTVAAGLIVPSSASVTLNDLQGPVYGIIGPAGTSAKNMRVFRVTK